MTEIHLPATRKNRAGAAPDMWAIEDAVEHLGIKKPIRMRWTSGDRRHGTYRCEHVYGTDGGERHNITLSTHLDAKQLSKTLWHELTHAQQNERLGRKEYNSQYRQEGYSGERYRRNKFEIEARQNEDMAYLRPLARQEARRYK